MCDLNSHSRDDRSSDQKCFQKKGGKQEIAVGLFPVWWLGFICADFQISSDWTFSQDQCHAPPPPLPFPSLYPQKKTMTEFNGWRAGDWNVCSAYLSPPWHYLSTLLLPYTDIHPQLCLWGGEIKWQRNMCPSVIFVSLAVRPSGHRRTPGGLLADFL